MVYSAQIGHKYRNMGRIAEKRGTNNERGIKKDQSKPSKANLYPLTSEIQKCNSVRQEH